MAPNGSATRRPEESCCGVVQEAREKSAARREKPQPWLVRKLTIFITIGIIGYAFYVYIARLCLPMIRQDARALGGRAMGIGFLVVFCVLGLMMLWAYEKVVLTSPGYAKYYVQKSPAPLIENALPTWWDTESEADLAVAQYQGSHPPPERANGEFEPRPNGDVHRSTNSRRTIPQNGTAEPEEQNAGITDALPPVAAVRAKATAEKGPVPRPERSERQRRPSATRQTGLQPQPLPGTVGEPKPKMFTRSPPTTPILLPQYRYCHKDGFLKPFRAHHCRACGTCVLKYDHHCPWIGQCVGARNHRFFMIFVFWALWFCAWTFSTLVGVNAHASAVRSIYDIDGQQVAIMAFSGLFILFTSALYGSHIQLICNGQSTVESLNAHRMREREERVLSRLHSWWDFRGKRRTRKQWDAEWGRVGKEGHPWWLGGTRANWAATMGASVWMWFLPIGKSPDDGLNYALNPRFDREGRWLPRREWPEELR